MSELELQGIRKLYEGVARPVIPDLDLSIGSGQMAVLVGPSGCGKSTTLRMVAGLEEPTAGTIKIGGRDVTHLQPAERDIAMVFQGYALYPHMSVFENMAFGLRIKHLPEAEIRARVNAAADSLGLTAYLERRPKALSGGQRQRVAIGRAIVREPKVFLFDEPLSNLDAKLRGDMRREIARIHQASKTTSMYVTHDQIEAMTLADVIVVLRDGVVQQIGSPVEIYENPANRFVAGFFGTPSMNFLAADLIAHGDRRAARGGGFEIPLGDAPTLRPAGESDKIVVGIRPERLSLTRREAAADVALAGSVAMREVLGAEVVLHVESAAGALTVRTDAGAAPRPGDQIQVWVDPAAIHLFDGETELRL
ncbi:MAG: sn-glycerol-3-phosphate ABC transporter ATP-binding protein UgpC [Deltaproteobacteria bacterium]|nr:sn-glycerol-3-phosphate ABC transporter ATP-binding protein UgpC [Deltaproteobacteria bacterium]MCW5803383.1 sn-glycerol-3-phosphate ABC transporter ATP-binding protein UgpC [Deltaproteobacteria bacterium]